MDIRKLQHIVIEALEDLKGQQITAFNTIGLTDLFDRVVIVTGTSNRHARSLAAMVRDKVKAAGESILSVEGEETGEWVLVDLGAVVVHIMQPAIRAYYNLEELWGAKPVALSPAGPAPGSKSGAAKKAPRRAPAQTTAKPTPRSRTAGASKKVVVKRRAR